MEYNESVMIQKGKGNYMLSDGDPMMGESGIYHFKFLSINPGKTKLYMEYGNKFKNEKPAVKTYELDIVIISQ